MLRVFHFSIYEFYLSGFGGRTPANFYQKVSKFGLQFCKYSITAIMHTYIKFNLNFV